MFCGNYPWKLLLPEHAKRKRQASVRDCTKSARRRFQTQDVSYLEHHINHSATWDFVVGIPSPYSDGVTDNIKADLLRNQRVLIRMCFKLCPRHCISAFGGKWSWDCSDPSQVFGALVNYKRKFMTSILSSWENYIKHVVSHYIQFVYIQFVLIILYYFVTFFYNLFIT